MHETFKEDSKTTFISLFLYKLDWIRKVVLVSILHPSWNYKTMTSSLIFTQHHGGGEGGGRDPSVLSRAL